MELLHQRPNDTAAYPVVLEDNQEAHIATWTVSAADVAQEGFGMLQLIYVVNDVTAKSVIWQSRIAPSLNNTEEPPEPWVPWVEDVLDAAADIKGMSVEVSELPPGSSPTVTYNDGLMSFELPLGGGSGAPEIHIGSDTPAGAEVLWINDSPSSVSVPQINDSQTSLTDTWSSSKIHSEIPVIVALTQEEYEEITPDPDTYYFIYEA